MSGQLDRRAFLAAGGAAALGGCHCRLPPLPPPATKALSDGHAHFFNAADLPVAGFVKYVLIPRYIGDAPDLVLALVDIFAAVAKFLSVSAATELLGLNEGTLSMKEQVSAIAFGRVAEKAHREGLAGRRYAPIPASIEETEDEARTDIALRRMAGHDQLARLLQPRVAGKADIVLDAQAFARIAGDSDASLPLPAARENPDLQCDKSDPAAPLGLKAISVESLIRWAFLLCQPRCRHVLSYLAAARLEGHQVRDAVNLLVDYDKWLDDSPGRGSDHADQVAYWTRYDAVSRRAGWPIRLHTFAGYDPLKHAEEMEASGKNSVYFERLTQWVLAGRNSDLSASHRVAGFKIYPPMGFRPDTNAHIVIPDTANGRAIRKRWENRLARLGPALDCALKVFFDFCLKHDVPIMTHARESNVALPGHGQDAEPGHWITRAAQLAADYPGRALRLCMGHFDLENCHSASQTDEAALSAALALNQARHPDGSPKGHIYFDISFDDRIVAGGSEAAAFLNRLARISNQAGDACKHLLFGSDWIMLANQKEAPRYLANAWAATQGLDSPFTDALRERMFRTNLLDFLNLPPTA